VAEREALGMVKMERDWASSQPSPEGRTHPVSGDPLFLDTVHRLNGGGVGKTEVRETISGLKTCLKI